MNLEAIQNAVKSRFKTEIEDGQSLATQYDNDGDFTRPEDGMWARLNFGPLAAAQTTVGSTKTFRRPGLLVVQLFAPIKSGTKNLAEMADLIEAAFRSVTDTGVTFRTPFTTNVGRVRDTWQYNVTCPFFADDVSS